QAQVAALASKPGEDSLLSIQSNTEAYLERVRKARELSERAVDTARRANLNGIAAGILAGEALQEAEFGNLELARQEAAAALTLASGREVKMLGALALARAGDVSRAQALADELNKRYPSDTLLQRLELPSVRASIELSRKNPTGALRALQSVSYELGAGPGLPPAMYPVYARGQTYLALRQGKEAAAEFQRLLDYRSVVLNSPLGALAHLGLGRAYALQGDSAKARAAYQDFLALWKDADPDIPILKQAKAEYAKLQ